MPTGQEYSSWMDRARPLNPDVPDADLTSFYSKAYGAPAAQPSRQAAPLDDWLPRARESNPGVPDQDLTSYWQQKYGESAQAETGESDFMRGLEATAVGLKSAAYGVGAGVGETGEYLFGSGGISSKLKEGSLERYRAVGKELEKLHRPSDNIDVALAQASEGNLGGLIDFLQYGAGRGLGEALISVGSFGVGGLVGRQLAKKLGVGMVNKEAARLSAKQGMPADKLISEATKNITKKFVRAGQLGTLYAGSGLGREYGEIMGDLTERSVNERRYLTGDELIKGTTSAVAAGMLEFAADKLGIDIMFGKTGLSKRLRGMAGLKGRAARGLAKGTLYGTVEAGTEFPQTLIEEFGKGNDPFSDESILQATRAAALGYVGGKTIGGVSGAIRGPEPDLNILGADTVDEGIDAAMRSLDRDDVPAPSEADQSEIARTIDDAIETAPRRPIDLERERLEAMRQPAATPQEPSPSPPSPVRPPESLTPPSAPPTEPVPAVEPASPLVEQTPQPVASPVTEISPGEGAVETQTPVPPAGQAETALTPAKETTLDPASVPRSELPPRENAEIYTLAKQAEQDMDIAGDDRGGKVFIEQDQHGSTPDVVGWKSPTAPWYKEITSGPGKMSKARVQVALRKIIADKGLDTGKEVEKLKRVLMGGGFTNAEWLPQSDEEWAETVRTVEAEQRGEAHTPDLDAQQAATSPENKLPEPTKAQRDAGNYRKGHVNIAGLNISVENPQGSERSGVDRQGKGWKVTMKSHYGYIRGTEGADQEQVDVFVKPGTPNDYEGPVFVMNQEDPDTQKFDEHKALLGFTDRDAAVEGYYENYADKWEGAGSIATFPSVEAFQDWLNRGDKRRPVGELESIDEAEAVAERHGTYALPGKRSAPMYLKATQVIQDKMPNRAGAEQVMGILANAGVKAEELEQTTLYDYLAAKQNEVVTKQEIMKFLEDNHPSARLRLQPIKRSENEQDYSQYTLPGGENYREWAIIYNPPSGGEYYTNHFEKMNVLAHARTKDRTGPNGERMLFIEELQSDWHLQGRKQGYNQAENRLAVPDAPFKNTWHEYALKEMLHLAAKEGYGSIGWTTGEQQNERYQIRRVVDEIEYWPRPSNGEDGWYLHGRKNGSFVLSKRAENKQALESLVGKDVASKIIQGQGEQSVYQDKAIRRLRGDDLVMGGRWAENLYDRAMPSFLKKYTKRWDTTPDKDTVTLPTPDYEKAVEYVGYQYIMGKGDAGDQIVIEAFGENGKSVFFETLAKKDMEKVLGSELAAHVRRREGPVSKNFRSTRFIQQADKLLESADEPGFYRQMRGNFLRGVTGKLREGFKESRVPEFTEQTIHTLRVTKALKDDVLEGQALFERQQADPDQMNMQFAVKPPTVWQGQEVEQSNMFGEGALPEEPTRAPQKPKSDPNIRKVPGGRTIAQELRPRLEQKQSRGSARRHREGPRGLGRIGPGLSQSALRNAPDLLREG